jgi:Type IV secretion-system coupling protein DNA-binding domain
MGYNPSRRSPIMTPNARPKPIVANRCWLLAVLPLLLALPTLSWAQESPFMTGATALQTNILILRCSGSENGGTSQYASRLIGDREIIRRQRSSGRDAPGGLFGRGSRRSSQISEQRVVEPAVLAAQIEQLPDLAGYLKTASSPIWHRVRIRRRHSS